MATGAVKWFDAKKGFGFLTPDLGPCDVFVHVSALADVGLDRLAPGDRVEFELAQSGDGRLVALGLRRRPPPVEAASTPLDR
jgi:cold shock protein